MSNYEPEEWMEGGDYEAKQFNRRIRPYVSGVETYICDQIAEAYVESYKREMFFAKKRAMVAAGPYVQINKDMKRFMQKNCTWHLEDLEDEIND